MEAFHLFHPFDRRQLVDVQRQDVDVAVADMGRRYAVNAVFFFQSRNLGGDFGDVFEGNDEVFGDEHDVDVAGRFGELTAASPDAVVGLDDVDSAHGVAQIAQFFHLLVQFVFVERFYRNDDVAAAFVDVGQGYLAELAAHGQGLVVHVFDARRFEAGLEDLVGQGESLFVFLEDGDEVEFIRRQGTELQRDFRYDAQGAFGTADELFQAVACRTFLQARADVDDVACRRDDLHAVNLVARRAVFDGLVAAGVGRDVAADLAAVGAAGVAGIEQAVFVDRLLDDAGADAGLNDGVHVVRINFQDFVHAVQLHDHAAVDGDGAAGDAGAGCAGRNRHEVFIGELYDFRYLFRCFGEDDDFRRVEPIGVTFFVRLVDV
ncbi:Uncharacterised protein [uncultured Ruminococcus sp.]|nr:Uncharacterised protein [uncultured Ruminococcus sp.]